MVTYTLVEYQQNDGSRDTIYHSSTSPAPHTHYNGNITETMSYLGLSQDDATTWAQSVTPTQVNTLYFSTVTQTNDHQPARLYIIPEPSGSGEGGSGDTGSSTSSGAQGAFFNFTFDYAFELNTVVPR